MGLRSDYNVNEKVPSIASIDKAGLFADIPLDFIKFLSLHLELFYR